MALPIKGYQVDDKLYISPESPIRLWDFSEDGVDYVYVQQEDLEAWKAANDEFEGEFIPYNFKLMCVQVPIWGEHLNDEWPVVVPKVSPELAWSANTATVTINADDNIYPTLTNPHSVTVAYTSSDTEKATIDALSGVITLAGAGDTTISAVFEGNDTYEAQTVTYTLTVNAEVEPEDVVHNMGPWEGELDQEGIWRYIDMTALQDSDSFFTSEQELLANAHLLTFSAQQDAEDPLVVTWPGTLSVSMRTDIQTLYYDPEVEDGEHYLIAYNNDTQSADVYLSGIQYTESATMTLTKAAAAEVEPEPEPEEDPR